MPSRLALLLACAPFGAMAFVPSSAPHFGPRAATTLAASESGTEIGRAEMLRGLMAASALVPFAAFADEGDVVVPVTEAAPVKAPQEIPTDWGIDGDYYTDAAKVVRHMRVATAMDKGYPQMETIATSMKKEMIDFVSFYRRFNNVAGRQSFSTLYTAINVLAGHYTSYGVKFPVPEKRRKRLFQEYTEIEKNIKKKR